MSAIVLGVGGLKMTLGIAEYQASGAVFRTGSALETTTFSSQSATVLVASLLLYVVFFPI